MIVSIDGVFSVYQFVMLDVARCAVSCPPLMGLCGNNGSTICQTPWFTFWWFVFRNCCVFTNITCWILFIETNTLYLEQSKIWRDVFGKCDILSAECFCFRHFWYLHSYLVLFLYLSVAYNFTVIMAGCKHTGAAEVCSTLISI